MSKKWNQDPEIISEPGGLRSDALTTAELSDELTMQMPGCETPPEPAWSGESHESAPEGALRDGGQEIPTPASERPRSVYRPALDKASAKVYAEVAGTVLSALGGLVNQRLALFDDDDTWIPADAELQQVSQPLGRIAARRAPMSGDAESATDIADGIAIAVGLAVYALRNLGQRVRLRKVAYAASHVEPSSQVNDEPALEGNYTL